MTIRFLLAATAVALTGGLAAAQPAKESADVNRRLAELEKRVDAMLQEVRALRAESKARAAAEKPNEVRVFALKHANASEMARTLKGLMQGPDGKGLAFSVDERTNSLLAKGTAKHLDIVQAIVTRLDQDGAHSGKAEARKGLSIPTEAELKDKLKSLNAELNLGAQQLRDRAEWLKRMSQKGFISPGQVELDMKKVEQARDQLLKLRDELMKQLEGVKKAEPSKKPAK